MRRCVSYHGFSAPLSEPDAVRVLLVNLPRDPRETMFPLELASLAAALRSCAHEPTGLDLERGERGLFSAAVRRHDVLLIAPTSATWPRWRTLLGQLSPAAERLVLVAGPHATLLPDEVLDEPLVDAVLLGDAELTIDCALRAWEKTKTGQPIEGQSAKEQSNAEKGNAEKGNAVERSAARGSVTGSVVSGVVWQERWERLGLRSDRQPQRVEQLGAIAPPDRDVFAIDHYTGMATRCARYTQIVATRGSDRSDAHATLAQVRPGGQICRPVEQVVDEMVVLHEEHGIGEFHFEDDALFEDAAYVAALCDAIAVRLPGIVWQCPNGNHPDDLTPPMMANLAAAGCYRIYFQLDSTDADAMRPLGRQWDTSRLAALTEAATRAGVELGGYFTLGLPGETTTTMRATVRFAVASGLRWAQFTPFQFNVGSTLHASRDLLHRPLPPSRSISRIIRKAYWQFYGTQGRWRCVLRSLNRRNAMQLAWRTYDKMVRGRPY